MSPSLSKQAELPSKAGIVLRFLSAFQSSYFVQKAFFSSSNFQLLVLVPSSAFGEALSSIHFSISIFQINTTLVQGIHQNIPNAFITVIRSNLIQAVSIWVDEDIQVMGPIASFLASTSTPLLVNIYPLFAYSRNLGDVRLDYSLFKENNVVVHDDNLGYSNLFDAMVDSVYSTLERVGGCNVSLVISETRWPFVGGVNGVTVDNARIYNNNLVST